MSVSKNVLVIEMAGADGVQHYLIDFNSWTPSDSNEQYIYDLINKAISNGEYSSDEKHLCNNVLNSRKLRPFMLDLPNTIDEIVYIDMGD